MSPAITGDIDVAQLVLAAFFIFFAGLVYHLRREDKREGYPLEDPAGGGPLIGFPEPPPPKTFLTLEGETATMPHHDSPPVLAAVPRHPVPGSPHDPTGDPLRDSIGPAAYALRKEKPLIYESDKIQVLPMRELPHWHIAEGDADPRGWDVVGADHIVAGVVRDLWIDRSVKILRYLEIELAAPATGSVLLPIYHADIQRRRHRILVTAARADMFADVPRLTDPARITAREEDQISGFFAGARFYRGPARRVVTP